MNQKPDTQQLVIPTKPVDWRESWAPAFTRLLAEIGSVDKLTHS